MQVPRDRWVKISLYLLIISINCDTRHRQVAEDDSTDNSESPSQTEGGICEWFEGENRKEK